MTRSIWLQILIALLRSLAVRLHNAEGAPLPQHRLGRARLAEAWCKIVMRSSCDGGHERAAALISSQIANQASTTALSLKVFLRTSHRRDAAISC